MIGGDSGTFRSAATQVRGWSDTLRTDAAHLRETDGVHWVGTAGDSFRERVTACADQAVAGCGDLDAYADALDDLAATLDDRQQQIATLLAAAGATWDEVRDAVVHGAGDALDVARGLAGSAADAAGDVVEGAKDAGEDLWHTVTPW